MNNGSSSISLSPLTSSEVRNNPYPAPLNSGRIGDFFAFFKICGVSRHHHPQAPLGLEGSGAFRRPGSKGLKGVGGRLKFIEGASLYKTFTTGLLPVGKPYNRPAGEKMHSPFGGWRHHLSRGCTANMI